MKHVSASQITTFMDCPRKWYLNKIVGLDSPSSDAAELGRAVHEQLETYLQGEGHPDESKAGVIAQQGLRYLPDPSSELFIESAVHESFPLTDAPVPVLGYIDVFIPPQGTTRAEIIDHKTTSSRKWTKSEDELRTNTQLMLYASAILNADPSMQDISLTHIYYGTKELFSFRVSVVVTRAHVFYEYSQICATIKEMMKASTADNAEGVYAERSACSKYGGCPFRLACLKASSQKPKTNNETERRDDMTPEERREKLGIKKSNSGQRASKETPKETPKDSKKSRVSEKVLYIGCMPMEGDMPVNATKAYAEEIEHINKMFKVPHLGMASYNDGWNTLVGRIVETGWKGNSIYLDPDSREYQFLCSPLMQLADFVIKRA